MIENFSWTEEEFKNKFSFKKTPAGFEKNIRGERYSFRQLYAADEFWQVVRIQKIAWGWVDTDLVPTHILALASDTGGGVFGAFSHSGEMIGFAAGFGGGEDQITGLPTIISSMLAMKGSDFRSGGIGKELKLIQAYYAWQLGYRVMKWFYDPERGENARLNMGKLGTRAEEFAVDKYGQMKSELYGPVPTDRFRAVWRFTQQKVVDRIIGVNKPPKLAEVRQYPVATEEQFPDSNKVLVQISGDIDREDEKTKIERRYHLRKIAKHYFEKGYVASEFISEKMGKNFENYYLLEPLNELVSSDN